MAFYIQAFDHHGWTDTSFSCSYKIVNFNENVFLCGNLLFKGKKILGSTDKLKISLLLTSSQQDTNRNIQKWRDETNTC